MEQRDYRFSVEDLEKLKKRIEERIKEVELWREYALKRKKRSVLEKLQRELSALEEFKTFGKAEEFLRDLNEGKFRFLPGEVFFLVNPYFGKARLTYRFPEPKGKDREAALEFYKNKWAAKLTAAKIKEFLRDKEEAEKRKYLQRSRAKVVRRLVEALERIEGSGKRFKVLRGDFRDYTLNVPRKRLFLELEKLGVPPHLRSLVKNFLSAGNRLAEDLKGYPVKKFFSKREFKREFSADANFRAQLNLDGVVPGSPLSNLMGQLFLVDFDRMMEEIAGEEGFYARFLDDFILIFPADRISEEELRRKVADFIREKYADHPLVRLLPESGVWELVKLETLKDLPTEFDFLGYSFRPEKGKLKRGIRYKTLKKFLQKYLHEYRFRPGKGTDERELAKHLAAKSAYLYRWVYNFLEVNDKKLLDELFVKFVLPDLVNTIYNYLRVKRPDLTPREVKERTRMEVKKLKNYFKLPLIHRLLKKECAKAARNGESCERKLTELVKKVSEEIEKKVTVK
ncbi:MAG: hypothetical protein GXO08_03415 [Aquificae bacterium]|nr:hypothetical protein [Aquificota bacterium]